MDFINKPLGMLLKLFSDWFGGNYLVAILIFALATELILLPFGIKQQKNSIKQARLRPKELAIRKKYAGRDDKPTQQKMAQDIQELYQGHMKEAGRQSKEAQDAIHRQGS